MPAIQHFRLFCAGMLALAAPLACVAADDDALSLPSVSQESQTKEVSPYRLQFEAALGRASNRYSGQSEDLRRASLDLRWTHKVSPGWQLNFSDRLDDIHPVDAGQRSTLNSLREAYASWQGDEGSLVIEFGRINLRHGPAYGFNPTDYFRDGALRAVTSVDPFALRENRLGTVMLRAQKLWAGGAVSLALAPKIRDQASNDSFSPDFGATNHSQRALLSWSTQWSDTVSGQLLAFGESGQGPQFGASATALLSNAAVAHLEFSRGRQDDSLARLSGLSTTAASHNRLAVGLTYTTASRLALTAEFQYNGAAPDRSAWDAARARAPLALVPYLIEAQRRQDSASRRALLLYATQKSLLTKSLDLTAMLRQNLEDKSRFVWVELRYHWDKFDAALQSQWSTGMGQSEYGILPHRQSIQLVGTYYF